MPNFVGTPLDIAGNIQAGLDAKKSQMETQKTNALRDLFKTQGSQILAGNPNALAAYAAIDPAAAMDIQKAQAEEKRAAAESAMNIAVDQQNIASSKASSYRADQEQDRERQRAAELTQEHAMKMTSDERQAAADDAAHFASELVGLKKAGKKAWDAGIANLAKEHPELAGSNPDFFKIPFEESDSVISQVQGMGDAFTKAGGEGKFGVGQLIQTRDKDGKVHWLQPNADGGAPQEVIVPDGQTAVPPTRLVNLGDEYGAVDTSSGEKLGGAPINNLQKAFDTAAGKYQGANAAQADTDLPRLKQMYDQYVSVADQVITSPDLDHAVGVVNQYIPDLLAGQKVTNIRALMEKLMGAGFMDAYAALKGGGQITEYEDKKGQAALSTIGQEGQDADTYRKAIRDFIDVLGAGFERKRQLAEKVNPALAEQLKAPPPNLPSGPPSKRAPIKSKGGLTYEFGD